MFFEKTCPWQQASPMPFKTLSPIGGIQRELLRFNGSIGIVRSLPFAEFDDELADGNARLEYLLPWRIATRSTN